MSGYQELKNPNIAPIVILPIGISLSGRVSSD